MIGDPVAIVEAMNLLQKNGLVLKVMDGLKDYLSCQFQFSGDSKKTWLQQPNMLKNLEKIWKELQEFWSPKTPNTPRFLLWGQWRIKRNVHWMFLIKHSRLDITNATWALSKLMVIATKATFHEIHGVIMNILDTRDLGMKIEPTKDGKKTWGIVCFSDNHYRGDPLTRSSIGGFILYLGVILVSWWSKGQRIMTLSSLQVEWMDLLEAVKK